MSKLPDRMAKEDMVSVLHDILEHEMDDCGRCRWCGSEEYPVNLVGEPVSPEKADEYWCDHDADCAIIHIETVLMSTSKAE